VPDAAIDPVLAERSFVAEVARGLATLRGEEPLQAMAPGDLAIPLGLSAWIVRAALELPDAYEALLRLRAEVLDVSGLDRTTEPVPLRVGDPRAALRSLGSYLYDLVGRAARHARLSPVELAERTLEQIEHA
jgi:hypothetical protein